MTIQTILYVANSAAIGGANRVLTDMAEGLDRTRFRPVLACPNEGVLVDWARSRNIPVTVIPEADGSLPSELVRALRFARLLVGTGASVVHAIDPACYRAASWAARALGVRRVCHIQFPPEADALRWVFKVPPDLTITCYSAHAAEVAGQVPALNGAVAGLPNAVHLGAFTAAGQTGPSPWKFGRSRMVLIVGHLSDIKGYPTFLRAAARIKAQDPDCAFVALGGETIQRGFGQQLEALAAELGLSGDVHFLGWRKDVSEIVRAADVFVLPSLKEGLPLSILEAMASSIPVVATPVNGVPEVITSGENGFLVPVNDPAALAADVLRLLGDPELRRRIGAAGRRTVEEQFSLEEFLRRIQRVYPAVLQDPRSGRHAIAKQAAADRALDMSIAPSV
jgi:glycosyltransferase involved in cell wall biosynthesis